MRRFYKEREIIAKGDALLMEFCKDVRDYCNGDLFLEYLSDDYWNKRIYKYEGLSEGKSLGIQERNMEIAKSMLKDGVDINTIQRYTGLSIEEISKLKEE